MDRNHRVKKLESVLRREKVHWLLTDGTPASAYGDEILDVFMAVLRGNLHPLLYQIRSADLSTYTGDDSFFRLIQQLCESRERRLNA